MLNKPTVTCNICMDVVRLELPVIRMDENEDTSEIGSFVPSCPHAFCSACLAQYLEVKMKEPVMTFPVKCPQYECNNVISDDLAEKVLGIDSMTMWWDKHTEAGMSNKIYCPHPDCAVPLENDLIEVGSTTIAECPVCNRAFCSVCKTMWHPGRFEFVCLFKMAKIFVDVIWLGILCEQNMAWTAEQKDMLALLNTADSLLWSCCPKCKNIIEKNVSQGYSDQIKELRNAYSSFISKDAII
jgi:IBR domain, a half RING-finger domain/Zinc finger, C3HC4 type (RING finger)